MTGERTTEGPSLEDRVAALEAAVAALLERAERAPSLAEKFARFRTRADAAEERG